MTLRNDGDDQKLKEVVMSESNGKSTSPNIGKCEVESILRNRALASSILYIDTYLNRCITRPTQNIVFKSCSNVQNTIKNFK